MVVWVSEETVEVSNDTESKKNNLYAFGIECKGILLRFIL